MAAITLEERFDKIRSPNLESQKQTAVVLKAVESTLEEQHEDATPTAYFAALLALLGQPIGKDASKKILDTSIIYLLDLVTPYTPHGLLRAKFTQILSALAPVLMQQDADAPLLRPCIGCLESLLLAQHSAAWELSATQITPRRAVTDLLNLSVDPRPKVRKRALEALRKVLDTPPPGPTLDHPAGGMCAETAMASLKDLAQRASQAKKNKRGEAQPANDPDLFRALQLVRSIAASSTGWPSKKIEQLCELLLEIARTGNDHMSVAVLEVFEMIFQGMSDDIATSKLSRLLNIISELRPAPNDTQLLPPWIAIVSRGYDVSAQVEPEVTFYKLPELFNMVAPYLESPSSNIRVSASECLISFLVNCIPSQAVLEPSIYDEKVLAKLAKIAEEYLGVRYQLAINEVYNVLTAMFDAFRWHADPFLLGVTKTIGDMRGRETFSAKKEVDKIIGHAIRAMGPAAVLKILPHNLIQPSPQQPGRAWLLPLFREYTNNTNLADFKSEFVPLSNAMFQHVLNNGNAEKTTEIKIFETIVQQIWSIFPGFCDLPLDLTTAFNGSFGELLANLLYQQVGLRFDICRALKMLIESNQAIATIEEDDDLFIQCRVTKAEANANLQYLGTFASQYLAVLFNVYGQTLAQSRGPILQTIDAFLSVSPRADLAQSFDEVCKLLATALQEVVESTTTSVKADAQKSTGHVPSTSHTLIDLVITMALHLPRENYSVLFEIARLAIMKDDDPQLQKKAYKLIPRLAESEVGKVALAERHEELQSLMLGSAEKVSAPARRERLAAIAALLPLIPNHSLHFIPAMLSEVVISCKEHNERARTSAFELLVIMGEKMISADGALIDNSKVPNMADDTPSVVANIEEFFTMVSAGLAGSTPHMISASITAITRILYEFHDLLDKQALADLVQTVDLFLTSNNREIVSSVLGFVKVCTISLPIEMVRVRLPSLIPNLMRWGHEHKGHFRAKIKHILDRMVRRFGYEIVNKHCPEPDRKLITNIRKTKGRNKRKKKAMNDAGDGSNDEGREDADQKETRGGLLDNGFDEALYSSDSDNPDGDSEGAGEGPQGKERKKRSVKGGQAYIIEEEGEPLDLLDRKAMANISSTRPRGMRGPIQGKAKYNADGRLVFGDNDNEKASGRVDGMDIDEEDGGAGSGVNAYLAAVSGKDVAKRGLRGKLKWSNKRSQDDDNDDAMDDGDAATIKAKLDKSPGGGRRDKQQSSRGSSGSGRGGRGGSRGRGHSRSGSGRVSFGRRGLGEDKQRGGAAWGGRVVKSWPGKR